MLNHLLATTSAHSAATVTAALKSDTALATRCLDLFEDRKLIVAAKALLSLALAAPRAPYLLLFACEKSLLTRFMRIDCEGANADVKGLHAAVPGSNARSSACKRAVRARRGGVRPLCCLMAIGASWPVCKTPCEHMRHEHICGFSSTRCSQA